MRKLTYSVYILIILIFISKIAADTCDNVYGSDTINVTEIVTGVTIKTGYAIVIYNFTTNNYANATNTTNLSNTTSYVDWVLIPVPWCFTRINALSPCTTLIYGATVSPTCTAGGLTVDIGPSDQYIGRFMAIYDNTNETCRNSSEKIISVLISGVYKQDFLSFYPVDQKIDADPNANSIEDILIPGNKTCNSCYQDWLECREDDGMTMEMRPVTYDQYVPGYMYSPICYDSNSEGYVWKLENLETTFSVAWKTIFYVDSVEQTNSSGFIGPFKMVFIRSYVAYRNQESILRYPDLLSNNNPFIIPTDLPECFCGILVPCDDDFNINFGPVPRDNLTFVSIPNNDAPVSDAGVDQTVNLNQTRFYLIGNFSNDPDMYPGVNRQPGRLAYFWTFINGPGVITIDSPNSMYTWFNTTEVGVYKFSLRVYDGQDFNIGGPSLVQYSIINLPPVVSLGQYPNNPIPLGQTAILNATGKVYDPDNSPGPLQLRWILLSGPNIPGGIANDNQYVASFTPNMTGYYSIRLYAFDGGKTSIGGYVVQVVEPTIQAVPTMPSTPTQVPTIPPTLQPTLQPTIASPTLSFPPTTLQPTTLQPTTLQPTTLQPTTVLPGGPVQNPTTVNPSQPTNTTSPSNNTPAFMRYSNDLSAWIVAAILIVIIPLILIVCFCTFPYQLTTRTVRIKRRKYI